jgi:hypothetical protein
VLTKNAVHSLNDPRFLEPFHQHSHENAAKEEGQRSKRMATASKLVIGVNALREKWGNETTHHIMQCTLKECGVYLQYKKHNKDTAKAKGLTERRQQCLEWINHPSPTASLNQSEHESDSDRVEEGYTDDAVEALSGMASMHASVSDE